MCRVRNAHTAPPWTTAYVCFTLDDNCTDAEGKYVDKPFAVRMVQWQPYCVKKPFDPKTPVCSACKKTNRTRSFCRERHRHRQLPWCTVYVLLSPADTIDPATRVAPESTPVDGGKDNKDGKEENGDTENGGEEDHKKDDGDLTVKSSGDGPVEDPGDGETKPEKKAAAPGPSIPTGEDSDDIHQIAESRTFLAKVSCKSITIHWLEMAEFDASDMASMNGLVAQDGHMTMAPGGMPVQPVDPTHYYVPHPMSGYAAQQHQFNLKSHQQYFFQLQQRQQQHYAAHQAAWQAQYNRHSQMQLPPGQPAPAPANAHAAPPGAPVTAGEAAAQQQSKHGQDPSVAPGQAPPVTHQWPAPPQHHSPEQAQQQQQQQPPPPPPPPPQPTTPLVQYGHPHHHHAMYHHHQPQHSPPPMAQYGQAPMVGQPPPQGAQPVPHESPRGHETDPYHHSGMPPVNGGPIQTQDSEYSTAGKVHDLQLPSVHGLGDGTGESEPKRQRMV